MAKFCSQCGTGINENDRFCVSCGAELNGRRTNVNNAPSENILLAVGGTIVQGLMKRPAVALVITDRRFIIAYYNNELLKSISQQISQENKGQRLFNKIRAHLEAGRRYLERYYSMSVAECLGENPNNYTLEHHKTTDIKLVWGGQKTTDPDTTTSVPTKLTIVSSGAKHKFEATDTRINKDLTRVLKSIYGSRVKVRRTF